MEPCGGFVTRITRLAHLYIVRHMHAMHVHHWRPRDTGGSIARRERLAASHVRPIQGDAQTVGNKRADEAIWSAAQHRARARLA